MGAKTRARVGAGVPAGGQFAAAGRAEADCSVELQPAQIDVVDSYGEVVPLVPGVIDDAADWAYTNGQCLALAVAVSVRTGWPVVATIIDDETGSGPGLLRHAGVRTPESNLLDIRGPNDPEAIERYEGESEQVWPTERVHELLAAHEDALQYQDLDAAASLVEPVLRLRAADLPA